MRVFRGFHHRGIAPECALTIGNFDGVHRGHQAMLALLTNEARHRALPSAVLTFEPHPRDFFAAKGRVQAPARIASRPDRPERKHAQVLTLSCLRNRTVCKIAPRVQQEPCQIFFLAITITYTCLPSERGTNRTLMVRHANGTHPLCAAHSHAERGCAGWDVLATLAAYWRPP